MCLSCGCAQAGTGFPDDDHGDARHITILDLRCAAEAAGVSLATAAQNIAKTAASLSKGTQSAMGLVVKADATKRFLLTVAYPAWKPDVAVAADGHIDVAPEDVVEKACWSFMRKGARMGMWHEPGFSDAAEVVENYIWRGSPWVIKASDGTEQVVMPGDWLAGLVLSLPAWALYEAGQIGGVSPQGGASRRAPTQETLARIRSRANA